MSYDNNKREPANYLRASSVTKTIHDNRQQGKRTRAEFTFDETEEVSYTLTHEKANDLINRLQAAMNDESGTGGVRISMYGKRSENKHTGEVFDGLGILVYAQKPAPEGGFKGKQNGNYRGGQQGRRSYPPQQGNRGPANSGTRPSGPTNRGNQTQGSQKAGPTQVATKPASRFNNNNGYEEQPDF